jgi:uncharacterized protein YjdB
MATLQTITVAPQGASLAAGATASYAALGHYSDGSTLDLTAQVTWSSSDTAVATVSNAGDSPGRVTAVATGSANIKAALGGVSGTASLTVTPPVLVSIGVTPANATLSVGGTLQYVAIGLYSDGSTVDLSAAANWTTSDASVASFGAMPGLVTGNQSGSVTVSAQYLANSGTTGLTVQ